VGYSGTYVQFELAGLRMEYDIIGDIHGQAGKLDALLHKLAYTQRGGLWLPPHGKQAIFVGDLIDRGPEQLRVVDTVRRMIDAGYAKSIMGNHEFNAIGYVTPWLDGTAGFLRKHSPTNTNQHAEFLRQVVQGSALHAELVNWFRTLPPFLDLGGIRVVHAWWHQPYIDLLRQHLAPGRPMEDEFLHRAYDRTQPEWAAMEGLTKGLEVRLPHGHSFLDHSKVERFDVRTKWWQKWSDEFEQ
jgi:Calcineurin-like phosphoesterase